MTRLLTDIAGPFYDPSRPFRNWSALPYHQLDLPRPPYVDMALLELGMERASAYLSQVAEQGYTGVVIDNLAHLVSFDKAPARVYATDDPARLRAHAYGAAFDRLFSAAAAHGMELFVTTDMQWATPGLRAYVGALEPDNPRLAAVNRWALDELFTRFPQVRGLFVRVGETGGAHDLGSGYTGHMLYRSVPELRALIDNLLPSCERHDRLLVMRTWSIGIGELGDMLWSPERYDALFGAARSPNLLVSVKHTPSDFFRHMPPNPTLGRPGPTQIVELQNRREYELFGMVPSSIARLHGRALRELRCATERSGAGTPQQEPGIWAWNCTGGWGGGEAALGRDGWSLWTELSSALTAALARDPTQEAEPFVQAWCAARFSAGAFAEAVATLYLDSEALIEAGWYLGPLGGRLATLGGIAIPSLLWVWWMRPTAAPLFWAYLSATPGLPARLAASHTAAARLAAHSARLEALAPAGDADARFVVQSARYLRDCVGVALALRALLLPAFAAARTGDRAAWRAALTSARAAGAALDAHRATWGARSDFPALELDEVTGYVRRLEQAPWSCWAQARLAGATVAALMRARQGRPEHELRALGVGALALAALSAWRIARARPAVALIVAAGLLAGPLGKPLLRAALPWVCRRYNLLPSIFFEAGPAIGEWTA